VPPSDCPSSPCHRRTTSAGAVRLAVAGARFATGACHTRNTLSAGASFASTSSLLSRGYREHERPPAKRLESTRITQALVAPIPQEGAPAVRRTARSSIRCRVRHCGPLPDRPVRTERAARPATNLAQPRTDSRDPVDSAIFWGRRRVRSPAALADPREPQRLPQECSTSMQRGARIQSVRRFDPPSRTDTDGKPNREQHATGRPRAALPPPRRRPIPVTVVMHRFWMASDCQMIQAVQRAFLSALAASSAEVTFQRRASGGG
jgi:hypothetical protein